ncbi:unnamed protein product [Strongylus vulgaris]|uniref:Uncharacterized protein n=1 Tax=Strongylus vulgaris TaxID=40348 RepID=A0A3P7ITJ1_STRVU|nr:unnamed protein product [Strongylus vulgaris]
MEDLSTLEAVVGSPPAMSKQQKKPLNTVELTDIDNLLENSLSESDFENNAPAPSVSSAAYLFSLLLLASKYLVAPFLNRNIRKYVLVSDVLAILPTENVFFCFYEYFATQGLSLSVCTEDMDCFYRKVAVELGDSISENKKWNTRCVKLLPGNYEEKQNLFSIAKKVRTNTSKRYDKLLLLISINQFQLRVIAENLGENKGEVGFLPIRLTRDSTGQDKIC